MENGYGKPIPVIDERSRPWWEAAKRHELLLQSCASCGHVAFPPAAICPDCHTANLEWLHASPRGVIWSWAVFHKSYFSGFAADIPYAVAIVELEDGPRVWTQIVGVQNSDLRIGLAVEAVFDDVTDDVTLLKFKLTRAAS
jgi:uncharacterized OB-fold protein